MEEKEVYLTADKVYPTKCFMRLNGELMNNDAKYFLKVQKQNEENGFGVQHPCFDCCFNIWGIPEICNAAEIKYHEEGKKYLIHPKAANIIFRSPYEP